MTVSLLIETFDMSEPRITYFVRPLSASDREDIGEVNLGEYYFTIALDMKISYYDEEGEVIATGSELPIEVGRFIARN